MTKATVSTSSVPVVVAEPPAFVTVTVTGRSYSPSGSIVAGMVLVQVPSVPMVMATVTLPTVMLPVAPGVPVPEISTPSW